MPLARRAVANASRSPSSLSGSVGIEAMVARVAPTILELLEDVTRTLMRLAVTGRLQESGGRYRWVQEQG